MFTNLKTFLTVTLIIILFPLLAYSQLSQQWIYSYNGSGNWTDYTTRKDAAVDAAGNIYFACSGYIIDDYEIVLRKFNANSNGTPVWSQVYGSPTENERVEAITLDNSGNIYIAGYGSSNGQFDVITLKYNNNGQLLWAQRYNGTLNDDDLATDITVDPFGNVYVGGYSKAVAGQGNDYLLLKYNSNGALQWVRTYDGTSSANDDDRINSIASDASGNIFVTGRAGWSGSGYDMITIRYTSSGTPSMARYDGAQNSNDEGIKVVVDAAGNFYVTGSTIEDGNDPEITTIKYSSGFATLWVRTYNNNDEVPSDMKVDAAGNVYVTGTILSSNIVTLKYSAAGILQWVALLNYSPASSLALDSYGNVYVTGGGGSIITAKYNANGTLISSAIYNSGWSQGCAVVTNGNGSAVHVTGLSMANGTVDVVLIKYSQPTGISNINNEIPDGFSLEQNYPNPFNPSTKIRFSVPAKENVSIRIYDINGKEVSEILNESVNPGSYEIDFDGSKLSSGTYFYKIVTSAGFVSTKKMMLVK